MAGLFQYTAVISSGIIILIVGGLSVARGSMTLGQLLSFYVAFGLLGTYLQTIGGAVPLVIAGNQSLTTLFNILRAEDEAPYSGSTRIAFQGKVSLESVTFHYKDQPVLYDVSLTLRPGAIVAIVGPNGAGKSTIVNLILGFYRPQHGQLRADGHPYSELDLADLRRQMGVVMQDPIIFAGTILENVTYGDPDLSAERVAEAARMATAEEFIGGLPSGYETFVGEGGALLSGGQRQRIAIARALARRPRVLILDEPTNHLDRAAVRQVMANLREIDTLPATLIISHDMDVIGDADIVYRLQEGRIVSSDPAAPAAAIVR
ncbi:MAG: ATP-binding cassette domain-containing protein [Bacillati bacterium ANGP1]|uniref:ATP-binding cassette domain-containing protein n=1 Tax=Candidatus Segetimicrobium genomatis TaxID=2569760 RepID=A0A537JPK1_9BACT|nr:MAG: ATP-binding cassette domain-containing protein [Terrabacteria group bacterium ANGP1]